MGDYDPSDYIAIIELLKAFSEYEIKYTADPVDQVEWHDDFIKFVAWLSKRGEYAMTENKIQELMEHVTQ